MMWKVYDAMLADMPAGGAVTKLLTTEFWTLAETKGGGHGLAMTTCGDTRPVMFPGGLDGVDARTVAGAVKSWNLPEASAGMAAINASYNMPQRMEDLRCAEAYDLYCTRGLDLRGKTVGIIGHLKMPEEILRDAAQVYILERSPQPGDYPDSACEFLLPQCDIALITGSTLVNKTLPRLLALCKNAYTILTGPTVPLCPALLELGIDRLAGLVVTDPKGLKAHLTSGQSGPPYPYGETFLLTRDRL